MYKNRLLQLVAVVVMLMVVAASGVAASSAYAGSNKVPFNASVSGKVTLQPGTPYFSLNGAGEALDLGKVKPYHADGEITKFDKNNVPTANILIETLTFKDGTLTIECNQTLENPSGDGVSFLGTDKWKVIGGTGQFSGAKGEGTGVTNVDLSAGTFTKDLTGTISY